MNRIFLSVPLDDLLVIMALADASSALATNETADAYFRAFEVIVALGYTPLEAYRMIDNAKSTLLRNA